MTVATRPVSFEEWLTYEDGTDRRFELDRGVLVEMGQAKGRHGDIMEFLSDQFKAEIASMGLPWVSKMGGQVAIRVPQVGRRDTSRVPDVVVLPSEQWRSLANKEAVIELSEPAPPLVVEVVSTGTETTDHRKKRAEYNIVGIPCYVLVDWIDFDHNKKPGDKRVTVLTLVEGLYDEAVYRGDEVVLIPTFPGLQLTASQIIHASV
ncbi:Uma2 family endonuclease (plasmid) [Kovacikia minuta CCNUW1]|uniref:Uma2 family endonuclease n=1 Tax=Kovacikia minuta TaxID=2931930 RepID=UPI001CC90384|nr:Uma2 family endonuclease [Kovacikia minuta]UBF30774.1 Uma2 family endonuclease [Kovacikia minuta CCNUW1]